MPLQIVPECAADVGSWCERIFNSTGVSWLAENASGIVRAAGHILLIVVLALLARWIGKRAIGRATRVKEESATPRFLRPLKARADVLVLGSQGVARRTQRAGSIGSLLVSILSFTIWTVAIILILAEVGINVAPLLASAGIAGVALGFGAQNLVKDFLSGISMLLEDQYGVGDVVDLGQASGTVVAVNLRTTTVRGVDGTLWHVRNGEVLRVGNSSQGEAVLNIDLPLSYRADAAKAGDLALASATKVAEEEEFADVIISAPEMQGVVSMTSGAVTIRLTTTVRAGSQWAFGRAVRGAIKEAFDAEGIQSPAADLRGFPADDAGSGI